MKLKLNQKRVKKKLLMNKLQKCLEEEAGYVNYVIILTMKQGKNAIDAI